MSLEPYDSPVGVGDIEAGTVMELMDPAVLDPELKFGNEIAANERSSQGREF